jgi:multidrug efflux pump
MIKHVINAVFEKSKATVILFLLIIVVGAISYREIPKESTPEVNLGRIAINTSLDGISPKNAASQLAKPIEDSLSSVDGIDEIFTSAFEGGVNIQLSLLSGVNVSSVLEDVRTAVDSAKKELPDNYTEPSVDEINTSKFPILSVILSGPVSDRALTKIADDLASDMGEVDGVLEVNTNGTRDEIIEISIDQKTAEAYGISVADIFQSINKNNVLVSVGAIKKPEGKTNIKLSGLVSDLADLGSLPVKTSNRTTVTLADISDIVLKSKDIDGFSRLNGERAISLDVVKKSGANILSTTSEIKNVVSKKSEYWPKSIVVSYLQDSSKSVLSSIRDLESNVIAAIVIVVLIILWNLGFRMATLVSMAIPGAFLSGIMALYLLGYTLNIVVLFALILSIGLLVDGAIVTIEFADRKIQSGVNVKKAFRDASVRMSLPIISSTITTLVVFIPLLVWDSTVGKFMVFLPITMIIVLSSSVIMALVFIPVAGGIIGKKTLKTKSQKHNFHEAIDGDPRRSIGLFKLYIKALEFSLKRPLITIYMSVMFFCCIVFLYTKFSNGVSFFPNVEPDSAVISISTLDDLSSFEKNSIMKELEQKIIEGNIAGIKEYYTKTSPNENEIGSINLSLEDWKVRKKAETILVDIKTLFTDFAGVEIETTAKSGGPGGGGKPIQLAIYSEDDDLHKIWVGKILDIMNKIGGFVDISDPRGGKNIEWLLKIDREKAAKYQADIATLGNYVKMMTTGVTVGSYQQKNNKDQLDIIARVPGYQRKIDSLNFIKIKTSLGMIPITNFINLEPVQKSQTIQIKNGQTVMTIEADIAPGVLADDQVKKLTSKLSAITDIPENIAWEFSGEAEDQKEAMQFLGAAFASSIIMMSVVLLTHLNSYRQTIIVMTSIIFSLSGVLIGLMVTGRPFGIVMVGLGIISLAGIVVNNNIVLIDFFNELTRSGRGVKEAALRAAASRCRPVLLTSLTTILGLVPLVLGANVDLIGGNIIFGAPSGQWWLELSSAIAGGLVISTAMTLIVTPSFLVISGARKMNKTS